MRDRHAYRVDHEARIRLSYYFRCARMARGWTPEKAAEEAEVALRAEAERQRAARDNDRYATAKEMDLWERIEVIRQHVDRIENYPVFPLGNLERRARLLGLTLALGLDRGKVSRLAGGI